MLHNERFYIVDSYIYTNNNKKGMYLCNKKQQNAHLFYINV
jgi:hypothetical protein